MQQVSGINTLDNKKAKHFEEHLHVGNPSTRLVFL